MYNEPAAGGAMSVVVVGAGVFGAAAALELAGRGRRVTLIDPGPIPHPRAESTDISKVVRMDYGADEGYAALMEQAIDGWRRWNRDWPAPLYHETGVAFLCRAPMAPGGFEHDSFALLRRRGHPIERLDAAAIHACFPAWRAGEFVDGYFNRAGGFAEAARVVAELARRARAAGVDVQPGRAFARLAEAKGRITGVIDREGRMLAADEVVMATGSWTPHGLPALAPHLRSVGQPVFHLRPADAEPFRADRFPVFGADISRTGYYGFPATRDGVVKIANHGVGRAIHPDDAGENATTDGEEAALRAFLAATFPALAAAPIVYRRVCVYCDTRDEHFWIDRDPERPGLTVAAGGSGHAFKFAPLLGGLTHFRQSIL